MFIRYIRYVFVLIVCIGLSQGLEAQVSCPDWRELFPNNQPDARYGASMAFDSATGQLILFGGFDDLGNALQDTWNWNGSNWIELFPTDQPPARSGASMAFDSATGQLILFGGLDGLGNAFQDTWNWNGSNWIELFPTDQPPARYRASMAFDSATGQLILFSGATLIQFFDDTWNWDGSNWIELSPANQPDGRFQASMAFDFATGQLILFGGANNIGNLLQDTWNWDGSNWIELFPPNSPPARLGASMAFDITTGQLILFGGFDQEGLFNDTWEFLTLIATATPSEQTICSGDTTSIVLSSNLAGTTFSWTVVQNGVTGASNGSGALIAQTLTTTTNAPGTATYTIIPTTANECEGSPITVIVTVAPIPDVLATPSDQTICSGDTTSIVLSSNVIGTTFSWTVIENGVTGASNGSGTLIAQTLTTTSNLPGTATYTITPTTVNGCEGSSITVIVTVIPAPDVIATPSKQTICSGDTTSIALSSNVAGTIFVWTVEAQGVKGASSGSGAFITQTLKTTGRATGTVIYTIIPTLPGGCIGTPITVKVKVKPCPVKKVNNCPIKSRQCCKIFRMLLRFKNL